MYYSQLQLSTRHTTKSVVDFPIRNPNWFIDSKLCLLGKLTTRMRKQFSNNLLKAGKIEIGWWFCTEKWSPFLKIKVTFAVMSEAGKVLESKWWSIKDYKSLDKCFATISLALLIHNLINLIFIVGSRHPSDFLFYDSSMSHGGCGAR